MGAKSLKWSEISHVSSRGPSLKLGNHDGDVVLIINPRLDGSAEILNLIFSKRADLFDVHKNNPFSCSHRKNITILAIGLLFVILSLLLYFYNNYFFVPGILGIWFGIQSAMNLYVSSRSITLENNQLVVNYLNKSISYPADEIELLQKGVTQQKQVVDIFMVLKDKRVMKMPRFRQTLFIVYPVLKQWHDKNAVKQTDVPA